MERPSDLDLYYPAKDDEKYNKGPLVKAAGVGNLRVFTYLLEVVGLKITHEWEIIHDATKKGHLDIIRYMYEVVWNGKRNFSGFPYLVGDAAKHAHFDIVQYLCEKGAYFDENALSFACAGNCMETCKYVYHACINAGITTFNTYPIFEAANNNNLEMVKWLWEVVKAPCFWGALESAASRGNMAIVQYLVEICNCCSDSSCIIDNAAEHGHLDVIQYLFGKFSTLLFTNWAIDRAASNGHLDVVKYMFEIKRAACTTKAMDSAAENGHLPVVIYLHEVVKAKHTRNAMLRAALYNHLDVVKYLYHFVKFTPKLIQEVIDKSRKRKHLDIADYLEFQTNVPKI